MPFEKGNQLAKKKLGMKYSKTQTWHNFGMKFMSGYTDHYCQLMEDLAGGSQISQEEKDFMDRYEKMTEYHQPKLARTAITGAGGGALEVELTAPTDDLKKALQGGN